MPGIAGSLLSICILAGTMLARCRCVDAVRHRQRGSGLDGVKQFGVDLVDSDRMLFSPFKPSRQLIVRRALQSNQMNEWVELGCGKGV
ncbi:MAG: hypothetical protein EOO77_01250 [Oxalobacteraceae bacterium]|nr:MAG: hypothetical protein EOO77_01250 [Oxalobacteraceae bacterium]